MAHCIPTYMLSAGLMAAGMSWSQALFTVAAGNTIVLVPILLNSHPGTKYGIPFPVFARAAYGTIGSNVPALMRALVACGWFGIQAWIGGEAVNTFFTSVVPGWHDLLGPGFAGHAMTEWLSFMLFWGLNIAIVAAWIAGAKSDWRSLVLSCRPAAGVGVNERKLCPLSPTGEFRGWRVNAIHPSLTAMRVRATCR